MWEEPFALTIIEHLASGHPVIATRTGAIEELVNEKVAILIDKDKEVVKRIKEVLENIKQYEFDKNNIRKIASRFNINSYRSEFMSLLEKI